LGGQPFQNHEAKKAPTKMSAAIALNHGMRMTNPNLFVVTGGPGSGKTTVLLELQRRGFRFASEVARQIIQEQVQIRGNALPWGDREQYTRLMLERSIASYKAHTPASEVTFADRGIPDTLTYARLIGLYDDGFIRRACEEYRYAATGFVAPPWKDIYRTDNERKQDFAEAVRTHALNVSVYRECRFELIELPRVSVQERAEFIIGKLPKIPR
jgi:predicted ATPase